MTALPNGVGCGGPAQAEGANRAVMLSSTKARDGLSTSSSPSASASSWSQGRWQRKDVAGGELQQPPPHPARLIWVMRHPDQGAATAHEGSLHPVGQGVAFGEWPGSG
ncbi:hypothetical protein HaLaN_02950 [Haematococcus lacustris]|uniref:Uncharacterized protein n=1 Tax=Haematococcus lacustris TaxID=44745 RepID=A0A699YCW3_HAELA|nr:hypothetical protein HaLaN_02950 [Haematococcus lacustris]